MIVAVTGGKGGVGKSTVAFNLAGALEGAVVDADLAMADLPHGRGPDLHDVLAGRASPDAAVRQLGSVALVPCGRSLAGARAADLSELSAVVETVERDHGSVVIDCPAGLRADAGVPLVVADACVLVTMPTPVALADAVRVRELARTVETPLATVVCNRTDAAAETRIADTLGAPVTTLPESERLARAQHNGVPVVAASPDSPVAARFRELADRLHSCSA